MMDLVISSALALAAASTTTAVWLAIELRRAILKRELARADAWSLRQTNHALAGRLKAVSAEKEHLMHELRVVNAAYAQQLQNPTVQ